MHLSLWLALVLAGPAPPQNPAEMATREEPARIALLVRLDVRHLASAKRMDGTGTISRWSPVCSTAMETT
jgi:hypothetical protein